MGYAAAEVAPVVARLRANVLASACVFADETVVPVLDPGRGRTKQGYFWAIARDDRPWGGTDPPAVVYSYAPGRGHHYASVLLGGYRGILQCDGYGAYKKLVKDAGQAAPTLAFCWSHLRRQFYDEVKKGAAPIATETLARIAALYRIAARIRGESPDQRLAARQLESRPLVADLRAWFDEQLPKFPGWAPTAEAIRYALESAVVQAAAPPRPIDGGLPTAALLAHIAAAKFAWHLPLHRQTQMLGAYGIKLDRSTLVHWIGRTAWWLQPLYALLSETVMAAGKVFCDDTPLPVLDRTRRRARIARLWCYAVDDRPWQGPVPPAVVYRYAEDRRGRHVKEHLDGFRGVLQVDGYSGYDDLARPDRPGGAITLAYCLAHARREFFDVHKRTKDPVAAEALHRIGEIYAIEARIRSRPADERVAVRQAVNRRAKGTPDRRAKRTPGSGLCR